MVKYTVGSKGVDYRLVGQQMSRIDRPKKHAIISLTSIAGIPSSFVVNEMTGLLSCGGQGSIGTY